MQLDDGTPVVCYDKGRFVVSIMRRTPELFLKSGPVSNWEALTDQAAAAVQKQGGLRHGQLFYPCPEALFALVSQQPE